jgi:hypothetical protein
MWIRYAFLFMALFFTAFIEFHGVPRGLGGLLAPPSVGAAARCAFPGLAEVSAAWAQKGHWYSAASASERQLYTWDTAITIHVGNSERYIDGCGEPSSREGVLRLRWGYNGTLAGSALPAFPAWSRALTCRALLGRGIAVVGDSLSGEFYDALVSALWADEAGPRPPDRRPRLEVCGGREDGGRALNVTYHYFDHLGTTASVEAGFEEVLAGIAVRVQGDAQQGLPAPIIIVNRGAHVKGEGVTPPAQLLTPEEEAGAHASINSAHLARLHKLWPALRRLAPGSPVFWRTSSAGHPFCRHTVAAPPLAAPVDFAALLAAKRAAHPEAATLDQFEDSDYQPGWHWDLLPQQNAATLAALPQGVHVLDVAPGVLLRQDSHPQFKYGKRQRQDCLHYCLPGPIDTWVELFAAAVRYGEEGGAEFFSQEALRALCNVPQGGPPGLEGLRLPHSRHTLRPLEGA